MTLWFVFALMTAAAIFAVLWPLGRHGQPQQDGSEAVVYKDQLTEIDRDVAAGLIGASEADAARVEISRRLLAASDDQRNLPAPPDARLRRVAAVIALLGLPLAAVAFYLPLGSPQLGDFPLAERARTADLFKGLPRQEGDLTIPAHRHLEALRHPVSHDVDHVDRGLLGDGRRR
jgi:cytochrome c-type biogenesis protein CcmH